jgi:hypothetical protein
MKQPHQLALLLFGLSFCTAAALMWTDAAQAGKRSCYATKFSFEEVQKACDEGGLRAAKNLMKDAVKRAKAAGKDYKCSTCHENQKTFELKKDAVSKLKPYL